jgi:hypothetical protein
MGAKGYLLASTLRAILGQRLLRRICTSCAEDYEPDEAQRAWLDALVGEARAGNLRFKRGRGCAHCNSTGYHGRIGVYELLELTPGMRSALRQGDSAGFAEAAQHAPGYKPLVASALDFAARGITTLQEVERVAGEVEQTLDESVGFGDVVEAQDAADEGPAGELPADEPSQLDGQEPMTLEPLTFDGGDSRDGDAEV